MPAEDPGFPPREFLSCRHLTGQGKPSALSVLIYAKGIISLRVWGELSEWVQSSRRKGKKGDTRGRRVSTRPEKEKLDLPEPLGVPELRGQKLSCAWAADSETHSGAAGHLEYLE